MLHGPLIVARPTDSRATPRVFQPAFSCGPLYRFGPIKDGAIETALLVRSLECAECLRTEGTAAREAEPQCA